MRWCPPSATWSGSWGARPPDGRQHDRRRRRGRHRRPAPRHPAERPRGGPAAGGLQGGGGRPAPRGGGGGRPGDIRPNALAAAQRPVIFKGLAADWPLVRAGLASPQAAMDYLKRFDAGRPVVLYTGPPEIGGRFFYDAAMTGLNFRTERAGLSDVLDRLAAAMDDPGAPSLYVGSTDLEGYLAGLAVENDLGLPPAAFGETPPTVSIWLGNRTVAAAHYDMSNNIACC